MSNKIAARNKKVGISPGQQLKRVDPAIAAGYAFLGSRLGEITGKAIDPGALEGVIQETVDFVAESVTHNAPSNVLNVLDGFVRALREAKDRS